MRTTNPIESTYATVRLRTKKTKGCGSQQATLTMVLKLALEAEKTWRRLTGHKQIALVMAGRKFVNGELQEADSNQPHSGLGGHESKHQFGKPAKGGEATLVVGLQRTISNEAVS